MYNAEEEVKRLRVDIDRAIQFSDRITENLERGEGGRETALVRTKLQEAKMWAGKILEALGHELPKEYQDKA